MCYHIVGDVMKNKYIKIFLSVFIIGAITVTFILISKSSFKSLGDVDDNYSEIESEVLNSSFSKIVDNLEKKYNYLSMFPDREHENEYINYLKVIKKNLDIYSKSELEQLYNVVNIDYHFSFNNMNYTDKDYKDFINRIKLVINNK